MSSLIFLDISKAFDTVDKKVPLAKFECFGISDSKLKIGSSDPRIDHIVTVSVELYPVQRISYSGSQGFSAESTVVYHLSATAHVIASCALQRFALVTLRIPGGGG